MRIIHESQVTEEHRCSPKGSFELFRKHMSIALGGVKDTGRWGGGHPFDVEITRLPPGKRNYPLHAHAAQTEYYVIVSGRGKVVTDGGVEHLLKAGDHFVAHPGEAHQIVADRDVELSFLVIADNHPADITSYPNTGKRHLKPEYRVVAVQEADYYDGEEAGE